MFQWVSQVPIQSWFPTGLLANSSRPHCCSLLYLTSSSASACRFSGLWWSRSSLGIPRPIYTGRSPSWDSGWHRADLVGQVCMMLLISLTTGLISSCRQTLCFPTGCEHINQCYLQVPKLSSKSAVQHSACGENASVEHKEEYLIAGKTRVSK